MINFWDFFTTLKIIGKRSIRPRLYFSAIAIFLQFWGNCNIFWEKVNKNNFLTWLSYFCNFLFYCCNFLFPRFSVKLSKVGLLFLQFPIAVSRCNFISAIFFAFWSWLLQFFVIGQNWRNFLSNIFHQTRIFVICVEKILMRAHFGKFFGKFVG